MAPREYNLAKSFQFGSGRPVVVESREIDVIPRPGGHHVAASELVVAVHTSAPPRAPSHVRPRYVTVMLRRGASSVSVAIRRAELARVIAALEQARADLEGAGSGSGGTRGGESGQGPAAVGSQ